MAIPKHRLNKTTSATSIGSTGNTNNINPSRGSTFFDPVTQVLAIELLKQPIFGTGFSSSKVSIDNL